MRWRKASVIAENRDSTADESKETHECLDTFDAVEQLLGQRIHIGNSSSESSEYADVVAV